MNVVNTMVQLSKCPSFPSSTFDTSVRIVNSLAQSLFSTIPCYFIIAMCTVGFSEILKIELNKRARWNSSGSLSFLGTAITGCERIPRSPYQNNNKERILTLNEDPCILDNVPPPGMLVREKAPTPGHSGTSPDGSRLI
uniref:Uncharacterized protein n=1 Tax=Trichuris muris TaxID=70415 RepID=A0A5S6QG17_TRIMR